MHKKLQVIEAQELFLVTSGIDLAKLFEDPIFSESPCFTHPDGTVETTECSDTPLYGQRSKFSITEQC